LRFRDVVTVVRAPELVGPDGATSPDWNGTLITTDYPGEFQPISSTEEIVGQERTESTHKAFLPADADVKATDRLRFLGVDYTVDGDPEHHRSRGRPHHIEAFCFRVQGG
jgi:hypothetical protein